MPQTEKSPQQKKENPIVALLFNIFLPVLILNQLTKRLGDNGPLIALLIALAFPVFYAIRDYWVRRHKSWMAALGVINILLTGGLALFHLEGIWFAVKEAVFPLILGLGVLFSAFTQKPLMKVVAYNLDALNTELIDGRLRELGREIPFMQHLRKSTLFFASSFFISSFLNFVLAVRVFTAIDPQLSELQKSAVLNEQIAHMTWMGFIVIALPLMLFSMVVIWHLLVGVQRLTGLSLTQILPQTESPSPIDKPFRDAD